MRASKTVGRLLIVAGVIAMMAAPAMAGNGNGGGNGIRTQSRLRDGSCQTPVVETKGDARLLVHNGNGPAAEDGTGPVLQCLCLDRDYCDCMDA